MKKILALMIAAIMSLFMLAGCGSSYDTLEEYLQSDPEYMEEIESADDSITVDCKDNTLIMKCDMGDIDESQAEAYTDAFESMNDTFTKELGPIVGEIEEASGIEGVVFKVQYTSGDNVLYEKEIVNDEKDDEDK